MGGSYWNHEYGKNQSRSPEEMASFLLGNRTVSERGCWEWTGMVDKKGYGKIKWRRFGEGRRFADFRVHRVAAFIWQHFPIRDSRMVCHRCDNPKCFNPEHLFVGTGKDNQQDAIAKGRNAQVTLTQCKRGHPFSTENTYFRPSGERRCITCRRTERGRVRK